MPTNVDIERAYYAAILGLTEAQMSARSVAQLRADFVAIGVGPVGKKFPLIRTGGNRYWYQGPGDGTTSALAQGLMCLMPIYFAKAVTITGLRYEVTSAGSLGSVGRLGMYNDDGNGYPTSLIIDAGTLNNETTGVKSVTTGINIAVPADSLRWFAYANQGAPTTNSTMRAIGNLGGVVGNAGVGETDSGAYTLSGVTGAFPANYTAEGSETYSSTGCRMEARVA